MREVVRVSIDTRLIDEVTIDAYYGAVIFGNTKGFIQQVRDRPLFHVMCPHGLTNQNFWDKFDAPTLGECIEAVMDHGGRVYEFNTPQHLFHWLAQ